MSEEIKAGRNIEMPDKETIRAMSLHDWGRLLVRRKSIKQALSVAIMHRTAPQSTEQTLLLHPGLHPWLRDNLEPKGTAKGVETVGDLEKVYRAAPTRSSGDEPWLWFGIGYRTTAFDQKIERLETLLKESGLLD